MTSREITGIALTCLSPYLLCTAIVAFPILLMVSSQSVTLGWRIPVVLGCSLLAAGAGVLTWRLANSLVRTCRDTPTDEVKLELSPERLEAILFGVLGVYFAVGNLKPFVASITSFRVHPPQGQYVFLESVELLALLATIVFGMLLIAKPKAWVRLLKKLRRS